MLRRSYGGVSLRGPRLALVRGVRTAPQMTMSSGEVGDSWVERDCNRFMKKILLIGYHGIMNKSRDFLMKT